MVGWLRPVLTFTDVSTTGISKSFAILANAVILATNSRFGREAIDDTCTGWKSMMRTAAFCGVSR
jgi:hypothetical protein